MIFMQSKRLGTGIILGISLLLLPFLVTAQVNSVEYGKNRVQYKKFDWKFYQSKNFDIYYNPGGLELAKYVLQLAEEELDSIENEVNYPLQRRATLVIYNNYDDYKTSNIGLGIDWQNAGGLTRLVNNRVPLYFDGNHNTFRLKVRQGIAQILTNNILFGDDLGEFASNQALLDLPQWLTDGYVEYVARPWSIEDDDALKNVMLSGNYNNFYQFAFDKPILAGHAFWYYIARKYKPQNVTYFLYLARLYKNLNTASQRICQKRFKEILEDFMNEEQQRYVDDIKRRRNAPRGKLTVVEDASKSDYYHFAANPNPKNNSYAVVQFTKGKYKVKFFDNLYEESTLLDYGVRTIVGDMNPNMPILAWDGKGTRLLCIYTKEGKTYMFVYDVVANIKRFKQEIEGFDQVLDAGFIFNANTLVLSAVKNGHSDIYTYRIDNGAIKQITNDVYDDLDPAFVSFTGGRMGIIFSSNRPGVNAPNSDTVLPSRNHFNIFLADINNNSEFRQITQLTNMKYGDARYPMQYNQNHYTFVSNENGINNRWAGFFTTQTGGLDTLYYIGGDVLHNPDPKEMDSTLMAWQKSQPDSIRYFKVYQDSTYTFPITNYQSSLLETRVAGNNDQVSEVRQEGDYKFLYKLKVDSVALRKRNVNARPTDFVRRMITAEKLESGRSIQVEEAPQPENNNQFQNEFEDEKNDTTKNAGNANNASGNYIPEKIDYLKKAKLFDYKKKYEADYILAGFNNNILINRYQPFGGYNQQGPIYLNNDPAGFMFRVGVSDIMEDVKLIGGFRLGTSLTDKDVFVSYQNYRRRLDWGLTYYRSNVTNYEGFFNGIDDSLGLDLNTVDNEVITHLYQANIAYPLDETKRVQLTVGLRKDIGILRPLANGINGYIGYPDLLKRKDSVVNTIQARLEYVYDNTINPTNNIWNGLRWKAYAEFFNSPDGGSVFNLGFDARHYLKIYRNFIWAVRAAGDFSLGESKLIYYLGGTDGNIFPKFNKINTADPTVNYSFQTLAVNLRGFDQNAANGSNNIVINSEFRLPVFTTLFSTPINNAFLRNFQVIQFFDLGTAWSGPLSNIKRPTQLFTSTDNGVPSPLTVKVKAGGLGPFAGGYGFGVRSTLLGYFIRGDVGWQMRGIFRGPAVYYFSLGFDF